MIIEFIDFIYHPKIIENFLCVNFPILGVAECGLRLFWRKQNFSQMSP